MFEEPNDQLIAAPEPGNLVSYLPLDAATKDFPIPCHTQNISTPTPLHILRGDKR